MRRALPARAATALLALTLAAVPAVSIAGCSGGGADGAAGGEEAQESPTVTEADNVTVDGLYVDNSHVSEESDQLKLLYVFLTLHPAEENVTFASPITHLTVNDANSYDAVHVVGAGSYAESYYYADYNEDAYTGDTLKALVTFEVPAGDLEAGRTITLANDDIPGIEELRLSTDDITFCDSAEQVAEAADPDGYAEAQRLREPADEATATTVSNAITGYRWSFFVNDLSYAIEFTGPNTYTLTSMGAQTTGTYAVTNGFVVCTNDSTGHVNEIPYTLNGTQVDLDVTAGFDVMAD